MGSENMDSNKKIDWDDYNYPICLKIFHYDSDETPESLKWRVRGLFWNHILILLFLPWNLINNIVNAAQGYPSSDPASSSQASALPSASSRSFSGCRAPSISSSPPT